jgi:cytoskeletal protein RodZ
MSFVSLRFSRTAPHHIIRTSPLATVVALGKSNKGAVMTKRIQKLFLAVAALSALAVGGSAIASAQQSGTTTTPPPASEPVGGPDTDSIQSGDQTTPDAPGTTASTKATTAKVALKASPKAAASQTPEAPGTEQPAASEQPGAAEQPGSESAANSDGPGGHADEPGNASADHQFQGQE